MGTPTRTNWNSLKKQNKVKDGAVKGVNLGQLLDDFDHAFNTLGPLGSVPALTRLTEGANKYYEGIRKSYPAFAPEFKKHVLDEVIAQQRTYERMANPAHAFAEALRKCMEDLPGLGDDPPKNTLDNFVNQKVRTVGASLAKLQAIDPQAQEIKRLWDPLDVINTNDAKSAVQILRAAINLVAKEARTAKLLA